MKQYFSILLIFIIHVSLLPGHSRAQETESRTSPEPGIIIPEQPQGPRGLSEPAEVEAFLDGVMAAHLESYNIAGAVLAIVKDGKLFFAKGYGYADVKKKLPVIADKTLFRTGSTGKVFTWTAVMQLVEKGSIDLDADINIYLKTFKIPETFPEPITMTHLLTHTPGFEDIFTGMAVRSPKDIEPLSDYLARRMPARVRPPGQLTAYSNYGTALAGYIVEAVSGMSFEKYVEENIFKPLDMMQSTFIQPLPAHLAENMSVGYEYKSGIYESKEFELFRSMAPAGSMSCTATDIAKFMIAHLGMGEYNGNRILNEETVKKMHSRLFTNDPKTTGNAHGFWEYNYNGLRIIDHGGDTIYFHTLLSLVPEKNIGFFVSYNSLPKRNPRAALLKAFLNRYYPKPLTEEPEPQEIENKNKENDELNRFTGGYQLARSPYTTYEKVSGLFPFLNISVTKEGNLLARSRQWAQVESLVFKEVGGQETLVFREGQAGKISHVFLSQMPHSAVIKLEGIETPILHYILLIICVLLFISSWRWPAATLLKKICKKNKENGDEPIWARLLVVIMSTLYLLTLLGIIIIFSDPIVLIFGEISFLKILLVFPLICIVLTIVGLFYVFLAWIKKYWTGCQRVHYTLLVLASLVFLWFLNYWNLLGFRI